MSNRPVGAQVVDRALGEASVALRPHELVQWPFHSCLEQSSLCCCCECQEMTHPLQLFPGLDSRLERRCCLLKDAVVFVGGCGSLKTSADLVSPLTWQEWVNTASLHVLLTQRPRLHDCQGPCTVIIHVFALPWTRSSEAAAQLV